MSRTNFKPLAMWFLVVLFFAFQFVLRLYPGLVMQDIMQKFSIDATAFGFLSSMYYFGYAGMQIPVAIFLDRFGPRIIVSLFALLCSVATLAFVYVESWQLVLLARFLIGVGSAVGFLGTSKVVSMVFPKNRYAQMIGFTFTFGLLGALYGGMPTSHLVDSLGWQQVGLTIFFVGSIIAFAIYLLLRLPKPTKSEEHNNISKTLNTILTMPHLMVVALGNLLMVGALEGFADVWGVTYLMKAYEYDKASSALAISFIFVGMLFGGPLLATIAERLKAYYVVTAACGVLLAVLFMIMLFAATQLSYTALCIIMFLVGILCCYQVLIFAIGSNLVPALMMGVTIAFLNSVNMFGGSFFHILIGYLLDFFWGGTTEAGLRVYMTTEYTMALLSIPIAAICGAGLILLSKKLKTSIA